MPIPVIYWRPIQVKCERVFFFIWFVCEKVYFSSQDFSSCQKETGWGLGSDWPRLLPMILFFMFLPSEEKTKKIIELFYTRSHKLNNLNQMNSCVKIKARHFPVGCSCGLLKIKKKPYSVYFPFTHLFFQAAQSDYSVVGLFVSSVFLLHFSAFITESHHLKEPDLFCCIFDCVLFQINTELIYFIFVLFNYIQFE